MATYTPTEFHKDAMTRTVESWREHYQALWEGWTPGGPAPEPPPVSDTELEYVRDQMKATYVSGPDIILWGDSMTQQGFATLAAVTGRTVRNAGVGGESSRTISARQGARPFLLLPTGGSIPASGGVTVTIADPTNQWPLIQGDGNPDGGFTGSLAGVPGTLTLAKTGDQYAHDPGDVYTFTRTASGSAVPVTRPEQFITDFSQSRRSDIAVIWIGRNNYTDSAGVQADVRAMVRHLNRNQVRYLVVSVCNGRLEGTGTSALTSIDALNDALALEYGRRFVDLRNYLIDYGLADASIPVTTADQTDIDADIIPNSLRSDAVHFAAAGIAVTTNVIGKRLYDLGWVDQYVPAAYPAPPAAHTNLAANNNPDFVTDLTGWSATNSATITRATSQAFAGLASLQIAHSSSTASSAVGTRFPITTPGANLTLKFRAKAPTTAPAVRMLVHMYDAPTGGNYLGNIQEVANPTGDWVTVTKTQALHASCTHVVAEFNKSGSSSSTDTVWVDAVDVWQ